MHNSFDDPQLLYPLLQMPYYFLRSGSSSMKPSRYKENIITCFYLFLLFYHYQVMLLLFQAYLHKYNFGTSVSFGSRLHNLRQL